jgi:spermidine synthase
MRGRSLSRPLAGIFYSEINVSAIVDVLTGVTAPARARPVRRSTALSLVFASGAAGLVWQMVWTTQFGVALGHEFIAVLAVMAAFFGGLAAGAGLLAAPIERSCHPGRWYVALEAAIGAWALLVNWASPAILALLTRWIGAAPSAGWHWGVAFCMPLLLLLPATMAMGATLPAVERVLRRAGSGTDTSYLGGLYAVNTAGAMAGLLLAVFWLIPAVGVRQVSWLFALVNLCCALVAWCAWGRPTIDAVSLPRSVAVPPVTSPAHRWPAQTGARLLLTGLLGAGYEVLAVRVLAQVTENTVYTYAMLLANFLLGTALGAAWLQRMGAQGKVTGQRIDRGLDWLVAALLAGRASVRRWRGNGPWAPLPCCCPRSPWARCFRCCAGWRSSKACRLATRSVSTPWAARWPRW